MKWPGWHSRNKLNQKSCQINAHPGCAEIAVVETEISVTPSVMNTSNFSVREWGEILITWPALVPYSYKERRRKLRPLEYASSVRRYCANWQHTQDEIIWPNYRFQLWEAMGRFNGGHICNTERSGIFSWEISHNSCLATTLGDKTRVRITYSIILQPRFDLIWFVLFPMFRRQVI